MPRSLAAAACAAGLGLLCLHTTASAQPNRESFAPVHGVDELANSASPAGAVYIPGVGFRYLAAGGPRVYGWTGYRYGYAAKVHGYRQRARARACRDRDWWHSHRCGHRW
jgi:hypothetical protein